MVTSLGQMKSSQPFELKQLTRSSFQFKESPFKAKRSLLDKSGFGHTKVTVHSGLEKLQQVFSHLPKEVSIVVLTNFRRSKKFWLKTKKTTRKRTRSSSRSRRARFKGASTRLSLPSRI